MAAKDLQTNKRMVLMPRAYHSFLETMLASSHDSQPGGRWTKEIINANVTVRDPADRIIPDRGRKMNIAFAIAEWYAMMVGIDDIGFFKQFIKDYDKYSSDKRRLDGAYGTRVRYIYAQDQGGTGAWLWRNQVDGVIQELTRDRDSRRAVIAIYQSEDLFGGGGLNTPCTLNLQFLIRDNKLQLIANMRSSDVVRGLTYDLFVFTMIQEYVARRLGIALGEYFHNAGSLHMYVDDLPLVDKLTRKRWPNKMRDMPPLDTGHLLEFDNLMKHDFDSRAFFTTVARWPHTEEYVYLTNLACTMKAFVERKRAPTAAATAFMLINDSTLKYVLRPWLQSAGITIPRLGA